MKELAAEYGVSHDFICDEIKAGRLNADKLRPERRNSPYRIREDNWEAWLSARQQNEHDS